VTTTPPSPYAVRLASTVDLAEVARCRFEWALERGAGAAAQDDAEFGARLGQWWDATADRRCTWLAVPAGHAEVSKRVGELGAAGADGSAWAGGSVQAVGMASLTVYQRMPWPGAPEARWAYVGQLWVDPQHRRRGVGRLLVEHLVAWARDGGLVRLVLNPSEMARPLYAGLGFRPASDLMRLDFPAPD